MSSLDVHVYGVVSIKKLVRLGTGNFALKKNSKQVASYYLGKLAVCC